VKEEEEEERERERDGEVATARSYWCWNSWKSLEIKRYAANTIKNEKNE
jgi:hypothetical protein